MQAAPAAAMDVGVGAAEPSAITCSPEVLQDSKQWLSEINEELLCSICHSLLVLAHSLIWFVASLSVECFALSVVVVVTGVDGDQLALVLLRLHFRLDQGQWYGGCDGG